MYVTIYGIYCYLFCMFVIVLLLFITSIDLFSSMGISQPLFRFTDLATNHRMETLSFIQQNGAPRNNSICIKWKDKRDGLLFCSIHNATTGSRVRKSA